MMVRPSAEDVRAALPVERVFERYGLRAVRRGAQYRLRSCPRCGDRSSREAVSVDARTGRWLHHGRERAAGGRCSGDVLDLVAACEGLDCRRDFPRVVGVAAELAGVADLTEAERASLAAIAADRARAALAAEIEERAAGRDVATAAWERLARRDARGEAYLESRGLDAGELVRRDAVRFGAEGACVAIADADGRPISIATRLYDPGDRPKVLALRGCSTRGTMVDAARDVVQGRDVVIVEGVVDALTARLAWPDAVVLGASGAANVPRAAASIVARARLAGCRVHLVPHDDEPGCRAMTAAGRAAIAAGFELERDLLVVDLPCKDLNDAWRAGWRPA
jgi:hypothetical protein